MVAIARTSTEGSVRQRVALWRAARRSGAVLRAPFRLPHPRGDHPATRIELGAGAFVGPRAWLTIGPGAHLRIGEGTSIAAGLNVSADELVDIGPGCVFSANVTLVDSLHDARDWILPALRGGGEPRMTWAMKGAEPVRVGAGCWLGVNVVVLPGVEIGEGCVVGAGAVVTKSLPPWSVAVGVPARVTSSFTDEA